MECLGLGQVGDPTAQAKGDVNWAAVSVRDPRTLDVQSLVVKLAFGKKNTISLVETESKAVQKIE